MIPDRSWLLSAMNVALVALSRRQGESWALVLNNVFMLVGAPGLVASLIAVGMRLR